MACQDCDECTGKCKKSPTPCPLCGKDTRLYRYHNAYIMCYNCMCDEEVKYSHSHPCVKYREFTEPTPRKNDR